MRQSVALTAACLAGLLLGAVVDAGTLTPPGGVAPVMKTLDEVEPSTPLGPLTTPDDGTAVFVITQPGAYHLTGNLQGEVGKHGIRIATSRVTVDCRGFSLLGVPGSLRGVISSSDADSITLQNGILTDWGSGGVALGLIGTGHRCRDLLVANTGGVGIQVGPLSEVLNCNVRFNDGAGIHASGISTVVGCHAQQSGGNGIEISNSSVALRCSSIGSDQNGIVASDGCLVDSCIAASSEFDGIQVGSGTVVRACQSMQNLSEGVFSGERCVIDDCLVWANSGDGIEVGAGSMIDRCISIASVFGDGIRIDSESLVTRCTMRSNAAGAGVFATGDSNWIDGNMCITNNWGVKVNGASNWIVRNRVEDWTAAGFDIAAAMNNKLGTIQGSPIGAGAMHNFDF